MSNTPDILAAIAAVKREEVAAAKADTSMDELMMRISDLEDTPRGFERALRDSIATGWTAIIAEVKKGSPSKGIIREDFDPLDIAELYQNNGATCLSVLTDEQFFYGSLRYLALIREQVGLPMLRKDFIIDPFQVLESRAAGADAILLIASLLSFDQIEELYALATSVHLDVLLEVHDEPEMEMACCSSVPLIGINNRNLRTFTTDLATTERLAAMVPAGRVVVSESGIMTRADIDRLSVAGAGAFLIGESLMREEDIGAALTALM